MNPALLQKGSNSFRTDSEIKDHEGSIDSSKEHHDISFHAEIKEIWPNSVEKAS